MKLNLKLLPAAALGMALLASCSTTAFEVPEIGTRFEDHKERLTYDTVLNMYVIPLADYETLEYERFDIVIPKDDVVKYYAPALSNSSNHAELYVRNLPPETDFFGRAVYSKVLEQWKSLADIEQFCKDKFNANKDTLRCDTHATLFEGFNCVEYDVTARTTEAGKVLTVHGFCMFDPRNPGYFFEAVAGRKTYQKDIDDEFLIRASGLFFEALKFRP